MMTISGQCQNMESQAGAAPDIPPSPVKLPNNPELVPKVTRKIVPIGGFFVAFVTVMTILLLYMDNTAMKHYQFKLNMSKDYDFLNVFQDDPELIAYIRQVHLTPAKEMHPNHLKHQESMSNDTDFVLKLLNNKKNGFFVEAGAYSDGKTSKTEWLERRLNWTGLLIQPDPRHYFSLRAHNRNRSQVVHGCLSPMPYPRDITLHQDSDGVKINSVYANSIDSDWLATRVKCFPLYSLLLAMNVTSVDYLSLEAAGTELQVLETIPFDRVKIEVIGVHLLENDSEKTTIKKFLSTKKYKFMQSFNTSYIFMVNRVMI